MAKKENKQQAVVEATASQIFEAAQPEFSPKAKPHFELSKWEESIDRLTLKQTKRDLFAEMLSEMRGIAGNCKLFTKYAKDSRLELVIRAKNIQAHPKDYSKIFMPEFITAHLAHDRGGYRFNSKEQICKPTLPKKEESSKLFEEAGFESYIDEKTSKTVYLVPVRAYTFEQFLTLVKVAVSNYRSQEGAKGYEAKK